MFELLHHLNFFLVIRTKLWTCFPLSYRQFISYVWLSEKREDEKWENEEIEKKLILRCLVWEIMMRKENEVDGVFDPTHKFFSLPNWEEKSKENVNEKKSAKLPQSFHNSTFNNNGIRVADFIFLVFHHFYQSAKSAIYHFSRKLLATYHLWRGVWKCTFFWKTKTKSMYHTYIFIVE